VFGIEPNQL